MSTKKWKIFIVTHKVIREHYYEKDPLFNKDNWGFINVSKDKLNNDEWYEKYDVIDMINLPNFKSLGPWYAETEAIYNIYKNNIHLNYDYIGFIHYDYELKDMFGYYNITERINELLNEYELIYLSGIKNDYHQRILADKRKPNQQVGDGLNCYDYIIKDYNDFYGTNENVEEWKGNYVKNICSAFFCKKDDFVKMMEFSSYIIESKKLDIFDTEHKYRFQGGIFERYFSVFLDKLKKPFYNMELNHRWLDK
jgi:hypothetical protein